MKVTIETVKEINKLYDSGLSIASVANKLKLGHSTVNKYIWNPRHCGGGNK